MASMPEYWPPRRSRHCGLQAVVLLGCWMAVGRGQEPKTSSPPSGVFLGPAVDELTSEDRIASFSHDVESRVHQLNASPRIYEVDDFLSSEECEFLKQHGAANLQPSLTIDRATGEFKPETFRTNQQMYVSKEDTRNDKMINGIVRRLHRLARIPIGHGEQIQVGRYRVGEKYDCHYDSEVSVKVIRPATIIVYLADGVGGGDTIFPMGAICTPLSLCCSGNATPPVRRFHSKKGRAILFYSHNLDGSLNRQALHGSCPVEAGEKWIMQAWFRDSLYPESPHYVFDRSDEEGGGDGSATEL